MSELDEHTPTQANGYIPQEVQKTFSMARQKLIIPGIYFILLWDLFCLDII